MGFDQSDRRSSTRREIRVAARNGQKNVLLTLSATTGATEPNDCLARADAGPSSKLRTPDSPGAARRRSEPSRVAYGDQLDELLVPERLLATLAGFFAALAALLACVGLYGVIALDVSRRRNEIGVRMALGAQQGQVLVIVLEGSLILVAVGIAIGLPATLGAMRVIAARLYGVSALDPATITGSVALMIAVAALAGFLPAYRASRVDPMVALRYK